ncbi:MAG TPA: hypothetical protein VFO85_04185, partial [Vicinamibacteria bacterium]|nr:hypothetical protein [Vicinamibacteria bacterium]
MTRDARRGFALAALAALLLPPLLDATTLGARLNNSPQPLPFAQNWTDTGLISANDDWTQVPGIVGYLGDDAVLGTGVDPQTILVFGTGTQDVIANQTNPKTNTSGGVAEFHITDPVVAFQGSGTADYPFVLLHLDTTGWQDVQVAYNLRDIDGSADNAIQQVALQYRIGATGN